MICFKFIVSCSLWSVSKQIWRRKTNILYLLEQLSQLPWGKMKRNHLVHISTIMIRKRHFFVDVGPCPFLWFISFLYSILGQLYTDICTKLIKTIVRISVHFDWYTMLVSKFNPIYFEMSRNTIPVTPIWSRLRPEVVHPRTCWNPA